MMMQGLANFKLEATRFDRQ